MEQNERSCSARCHPGLLAQGLACGGGKLSILVLLRLGKGGLQGDLPEVLGQVAGKRQCSARTRKQQTNPAGVWSSEQAEGVALPITRYLTAPSTSLLVSGTPYCVGLLPVPGAVGSKSCGTDSRWAWGVEQGLSGTRGALLAQQEPLAAVESITRSSCSAPCSAGLGSLSSRAEHHNLYVPA